MTNQVEEYKKALNLTNDETIYLRNSAYMGVRPKDIVSHAQNPKHFMHARFNWLATAKEREEVAGVYLRLFPEEYAHGMRYLVTFDVERLLKDRTITMLIIEHILAEHSLELVFAEARVPCTALYKEFRSQEDEHCRGVLHALMFTLHQSAEEVRKKRHKEAKRRAAREALARTDWDLVEDTCRKRQEKEEGMQAENFSAWVWQASSTPECLPSPSKDILCPDPHTICAGQEVRQRLKRAMEKLYPVEREVLHLRFFEGYTFKRIGAALELGHSRARELVERALRKLRYRMRNDCEDAQELQEYLSECSYSSTYTCLVTIAHERQASRPFAV